MLHEGDWKGSFTVDRIVGIHEAYSGSSHFSGLTDIAMNGATPSREREAEPAAGREVGEAHSSYVRADRDPREGVRPAGLG